MVCDYYFFNRPRLDKDGVKLMLLKGENDFMASKNWEEIKMGFPICFSLGTTLAFGAMTGDGLTQFEPLKSCVWGVATWGFYEFVVFGKNLKKYYSNKRKIKSILKKRPELKPKFEKEM